MEAVVEAMRLMVELEVMRPIWPEQEARILQKFRLDWNYHSNHLEGNSLTFGETKSLLLFGITAQGKPLKDHLEMTGHNEALNWVLDVVKGEYPLTESFIRELHKLLLREPYEVDAETPDGKPTKRMIQIGQYKSVPNHVRTATGEIHYFASVEETPSMVHDLMDWYRAQREKADTNPIFLAALFHHRFINIHPFDDGNGRTGRLLMNFILMQYGYPPVIIKTEDKINYYRALQQADGGNTDAFVDYMAVNLVRSLKIMLSGARGESIEEPDDLDKELALLDQRLKGMGKKAEVLKSKEAILEVYDDSVRRLSEAIEIAGTKFFTFYHKSEFHVLVDNMSGFDPHLTATQASRSRVENHTLTISPVYSFSKFKYFDLGVIGYLNLTAFKFEIAKYNLFFADGSVAFTKNYGEQLTDDEISRVVQFESKKHKEFIDQKTKEFEERNR